MMPCARMMVLVCGYLLVCTSTAGAQARRPDEGGTTTSLGQPKRWQPTTGIVGGIQTGGGEHAVAAEVRLGAYTELASRVLGLGGVHAELFGGSLDTKAAGGARIRVASPFLRLAAGVDYSFPDGVWRPMVSLVQPVRRGGLFRDGTVLRFDVRGGPQSALLVGVETPVLRNIPTGKTRARRDYVPLRVKPRPPRNMDISSPDIRRSLNTARVAAHRIQLLTVPWVDHTGRGGAGSDQAVIRRLEAIRDSLAAITGDSTRPAVERESQRYHDAIDLAFSLAVNVHAESAVAGGNGASSTLVTSPTSQGRRVAEQARQVLLDEVLLPYDRLLGQDKREDTTVPFVALARGAFLRWLHVESGVSDGAVDATLAVFSDMLDLVETLRAGAHREWGSARYVWLPLQLALRPEQHDSQAELDQLLTRATHQPFRDGNSVSYVINEQFQWQLSRTIRAARDYHVLWIHDIRGYDAQGNPDEMSFRHVLRSYYTAMTARVRDYDRTGRFPTYVILLDQFFYEARKSRLWMTLLENPLSHQVSLGKEYRAWEDSLAVAQQELRDAVNHSALLTAQRKQYGEAWLRNLVKIHVNITNIADPTFWSWRIATGFPVPDTWMRDHRKVAFYDISEDDPNRGEAILTGAGVGEHYANLSWEDRSLLLRGPAALALKQAAREVLLSQGMTGDRIPALLQPRALSDEYAARVEQMGADGARRLRAAILQNGTGFSEKQITVAKAILYTLMPPGSVIKIPDSLWNGTFWGSALMGASLRGARVLVITPALVNAPARSFGSMIRSRELLWRLLMASKVWQKELSLRGGMLKVGIFNSELPVTNIPAKVLGVRNTLQKHQWLHDLFDFPPSVYTGLEALAAQYATVPFPVPDSTDFEYRRNPQLHMKANFIASREAWRVMAREEWVDFTRQYVPRRMTQVQSRESAVQSFGDHAEPLIDVGEDVVRRWYAELPAEQRARVVFYTLLGSANQNDRSFSSDGEIVIALSNWPAVIPYLDLLSIIGQSKWVETADELETLLPRRSIVLTRVAHWFKAMF
jgi:phosphatidylserine/phosphatidylglycerophosphate/cardiolipin synthase-like enzyme